MPERVYREPSLSVHGYKSKLHVISNGVAPEYKPLHSPKPDELKSKFVILFTGRFAGEKRHDLLVKAVAKSKYRDRIHLIFAGKGPRENSVMNLAKKLGIELPEIGLHTPEELNKIINYSDLYVHPADVEIEAIAALEAITCGLVPVINDSPRSATRHFAIDGRSLFDGTPEDLADKIDYWIEHPAEKEEMGKRYIEYSSRFKLDHCIDLMVEMFKEAAADGQKMSRIYGQKLYYSDKRNDDFMDTDARLTRPIDAKYRYESRNPVFRVFSFILYWFIALPVFWILCKLVYGIKVVGRKNLKKIKGGCVFYSNHVCVLGLRVCACVCVVSEARLDSLQRRRRTYSFRKTFRPYAGRRAAPGQYGGV